MLGKIAFFLLILLMIVLGRFVLATIFPPLTDRTVVLTAFKAEATPYLERLTLPVDITAKAPFCDQAVAGSLSGQAALVVITGVGKVRASTCLLTILQLTSGRVKGVIFSGTSGITPEITANQFIGETMIGDVCINVSAIDFDRQHYSADLAGSGDPAPSFWLDEVIGSTSGTVLSDRLYQASSQASLPPPPESAIALNNQYHRSSRPPRVWGPQECLEVSGDLFWHDIRSDTQAKALAAQWQKTDADKLVIVTAMESAAVGSVVTAWNSAYQTAIPVAYVRGASNFDQPPKDSRGAPLVDGQSSLETSLTGDTEDYAARTSAAVVLKFLESGGL